jgi:hypothetical protein
MNFGEVMGARIVGGFGGGDDAMSGGFVIDRAGKKA